MSESPTTETIETTEPKTEDQTTPSPTVNVRETAAFKAVVAQAEKAKNDLAAFKAEQQDAVKAAAQAKLAEEGNYAEAIRLAQSEVEAFKAEANDAKLTAALAMAGMTSPVGVTYARTLYKPTPEQSMDEFVTEFIGREDVAPLLAGTPAAVAIPAASGAAGAPRSTPQGTLAERLVSKDVETAKAARLEYVASLGVVTKG